jgi:hypothetical protein
MQRNTEQEEGVMKATVRLTRMGLIVVLAAAVCLMMAGTAMARVAVGGGNGLQDTAPVTTWADFQQAKTLANTDYYQAVPVSAPTGLSTPEIVAIAVGVAAAICCLIAFLAWRSRRGGEPAVAATPFVGTTGRAQHRKAA